MARGAARSDGVRSQRRRVTTGQNWKLNHA